MSLYDARKDFAYSTIPVGGAPSPSTTGTSLKVASAADRNLFPTPPFRATVWPPGVNPLSSNAEIVQVNGTTGTDGFVVARAQESSTAQSIVAGWQIAATITRKPFDDIEAAISQKTDVTMGTSSGADFICDGQNDEVQLLAACNQVGQAGGGTVRVLPGTYYFSDSSRVQYSNVSVIGAGMGSTIFTLLYDVGQGILKFQHSDATTPISNIRVKDLSFNLNSFSTPGISWWGVTTATTVSDNFTAENVEFYGRGVDNTGSVGCLSFKGTYGNDTHGSLRGITLKNCIFRDGIATTSAKTTGYSILFLTDDASDVYLDNCKFRNTYGDTIAIVGTGVNPKSIRKNWNFDGCSFYNTALSYDNGLVKQTSDIGDVTRLGFDGLRITNCQFEALPTTWRIPDTGTFYDPQYYNLLIYDTLGLIISHNIFKYGGAVIAPGYSNPVGNENLGYTFSDNLVWEYHRFGDLDGMLAGTYANNTFYKLRSGTVLGGYNVHEPSVYTGNLFVDCYYRSSQTLELARNIFLIEQGGNILTNNTVYNSFALSAPSAPTATVASGSGNLNGAYTYKVTFVTNTKEETAGGTTSNSVVVSNGKVNVSSIPVGPTGTYWRNLYRTAGNGADGTQLLVAQIADNSTTTYADNIADSALGVAFPTSNSLTSQMKYFVYESGNLHPDYPNVYKDNTIIGPGSSSKTFFLNASFAHIVQGNTGLTESLIQNSANNTTIAISNLPTTDVVSGNFQMDGSPIKNQTPIAATTIRGTQNPKASVSGYGEFSYNPADGNLYFQNQAGTPFVVGLTAGTSTSTSSTSTSSTSTSSTSSSSSTSSTSSSSSTSSTSSSTSSTSHSTSSTSHSTSSTSSSTSRSTSSTSTSTTVLAFT